MADDAKKNEKASGKSPEKKEGASSPKIRAEEYRPLLDSTNINSYIPSFFAQNLLGLTTTSSGHVPGSLSSALGTLQLPKSEREIELEKKTSELTAQLNAIRNELAAKAREGAELEGTLAQFKESCERSKQHGRSDSFSIGSIPVPRTFSWRPKSCRRLSRSRVTHSSSQSTFEDRQN